VTTPNLDSVNFAAIAAGVYQVIATRSAGATGAGCSSLREHRDQRQDAKPDSKVERRSATPLVPWPLKENTGRRDGCVQRQKFLPWHLNYNYAWSDPNAAGLTLPPNQAAQTGTANVYPNLQDGTYEVMVTNSITGCFMVATTTILKNATPGVYAIGNAHRSGPLPCRWKIGRE